MYTIITGATGHIGRAISLHLAKKGFCLILVSRNSESLELLQKEIYDTTKQKVEWVAVDYANVNSFQYLTDHLQKKKIKVSGMVLMTPRPHVSDDLFPKTCEWEDLFQTGFTAPLELIKTTMPYFSNPAKLLIISGIGSLQVLPNHPSAFGVLRTMWLAQAKFLSHRLGLKGIHVNSLSLAGVLTPYMKNRISEKANVNHRNYDEQYEESVQNVPLRKYASEEEVGQIVQFFLSDMSNHVTGVNMPFDGGFTPGY